MADMTDREALEQLLARFGLTPYVRLPDPDKVILVAKVGGVILDMSVDLDRRVGSRDMAEPYAGDVLIKLLALPYAERDGYLPEWRP